MPTRAKSFGCVLGNITLGKRLDVACGRRRRADSSRGGCEALVFWTQYAQASCLRRLHLAAQSSETLFVMVRPLAAAQDASPTLLPLALKLSADGLTVDIIKRRALRARSPW